MAANLRRLFFALWPDPALQETMAAAGAGVARDRALGGRDIPPERIHLTLLFLGNVPAQAEKRLLTAAGHISAPSFDLMLDRAGCFFRSRVFWLAPTTTPRKLTGLAEALRTSMAGIGLSTDRKELVAHVTCRRDIGHVIRPVPVTPIVWRVRQFALVHSELGAQPRYHVVSHWPLQNASR